jgi:hypothetical protein
MARVLQFMTPMSVRTLLVAIGMCLLTARTMAADSTWITDTRGCNVWNPHPHPSESATWSGECVEGRASGTGVLRWFLHGQPNGIYTGALRDGVPDGKGVYQYTNGDRYEGEFLAGRFEGHGIYRYPDGNYFEGDFTAGRAAGRGTLRLTTGEHYATDFLNRGTLSGMEDSTAVVLLNVCVTAGGLYDSVTLVQSSGVVSKDIVALHAAKVGGVQAAIVNGKPVPACFMEAVRFTPYSSEFVRNEHR